MKKTIATALTAIIATVVLATACFAGCAKKSEPVKQYSSAYLDGENGVVVTTVDLSDGYSCEFSRGAVYLYDKDANNAAIAITLDQDVYEDYVSHSQAASDCKEFKGGLMYKEDNAMVYICKVGDSEFFGIFAEGANASQMESIVTRFDVTTGI
ncbi:MAG: hypothetical protein IKE92_04985 [Clostridiales bacterium]|nr:hypothetical protein [Clostridiales bacterium]